MPDRVLVAITKDGLLRARAANASGVVAEALIRHLPGSLAARALGRALVVGAVYPASEKDCERVSLQWSGAGPLGTIVVELRPPGRLRALATVPGAAPRPGFPGRRGLGHNLLPGGFLSVLRQDHQGAFVRGQVELISGEIDEDAESYLAKSEQIPSRLRAEIELGSGGLSVAASGILVQTLPGGDPESLPCPRIHERFRPADDPRRILDAALDGRPYEIIDEFEPVFACTCNRDRLLDAIGLLDAAEIQDMIVKDQGAKAHCDFCATHYTFNQDDLAEVLRRKTA